MGILERLVNEGAVTIGMVVTSQSNVLSICGIDALPIFYRSGAQTKLRAVVNRWKFQDAVMGERHITFNITSETPISWGVGDYCIFRGETYTLNYVPSVTQKARTGETQDAYTYESVKFESPQEELTRCMMLDITPTTGEYIASLGTNYTGSSRFPLYCGETMIDANGHITSDASQAVKTLTPVCALAAKMQANLDRMYGDRAWIILVDTESTYTNPSGVTELVTHTEDKLMTFDNMTVSAALAEVHNTFDLDYCVMGRRIEIGFPQANLTGDAVADRFFFGYGKGYPTHDSMNTGLFQIKKSSNSQQKIVTRLRVLGSTKNMPYRYYNKKYADGSPDLSQTLFPTNLQLPDTFIQEGSRSDAAGTNSKWGHNKQRDPLLRAVQGDTNDAYIDKNDDAEHCAEGIREDSVRFDGSNSDLPEIYPTIEGAIFSELRGALVEDQDGKTGGNGNTPSSAFYPYANAERIDSLLAVGYLDNGTLVDDANAGDGILPDSDASSYGIVRDAVLDSRTLSYNSSNYGDWSLSDGIFKGEERTLFTINGVSPGKYVMAPTIGAVMYGYSISTSEDMLTANIGYIIKIKQTSLTSGVTSELAVYPSDYRTVKRRSGTVEVELPRLPDVERQGGAKVPEIKVTDTSDIVVTFTPTMKIGVMPSASSTFTFTYKVNNSTKENAVTLKSQYTWSSDDDSSSSKPFHVFIKDMGFDITACWTDDTPVVAMKSGRCVGREFEIGKSVEKVTYNGKKGYMLTLNRASDDSIHTYYPSETNPIAAGDFFVLLNISMPDIYVKMAEVRLLRAATNYLSDNCETQFTYQPYIDDIYLRRNYDNMLAAGTPEKSILWRLYAGRKFTFLGVPASESDPLPQAEITIASLSIQMGEGMTPKTEITLNDDVQRSPLQKLTTTVNRIYNGSIFASGSSSGGSGIDASSLYSLLQSEGGRMFLSKRSDDETPYTLTMGGANVLGDLDVAGDTALSGNTIFGSVPFTPDSTGYGYIENQGGHFLQVENLKVLGKMEAKEVEIQEVNYVGGSIVLTPANGIKAVTEVEHDTTNNRYKLYYNTVDSEGNEVKNTWQVGDLAYSERWDIKTGSSGPLENHLWWRKVVAVGDGYITVSDVSGEKLAGSDVPEVGDKVVMLGNTSDTTRQNAIILSSSQQYAPYIRVYTGIHTFELPEYELQLKPGDNLLSGRVRFQDGTNGKIEEVLYKATYGKGNIVRNTAFRGDYLSRLIEDGEVVEADDTMFNPSLKYWTTSNATVQTDNLSASGVSCILASGSMAQTLLYPLVAGEKYVVTFRAKGTSLKINVGSETARTISLTNAYKAYTEVFTIGTASDSFSITNANCTICEIQMERGEIPSTWHVSPYDNNSDLAEIQDLQYLTDAMKDYTDIDGGLVLTRQIRLGEHNVNGQVEDFTEHAGANGAYTSDNSVAFWGGGTLEQAIRAVSAYVNNETYQPTAQELANMAKFVVTHGGRAILNDVILRGYIYALGGVFKGELEAATGTFKGFLRSLFEHASVVETQASANKYSLSGDHCNLIVDRGNEYVLPCADAHIGKRIVLVDAVENSDSNTHVAVSTANSTGIIGFLGDDVNKSTSVNPSKLMFINGTMEFICTKVGNPAVIRWVLISNQTAWSKSSDSIFKDVDARPLLCYYGLLDIEAMTDTASDTVGITEYYKRDGIRLYAQRVSMSNDDKGRCIVNVFFPESATWNQNAILTVMGMGHDNTSSHRATYVTIESLSYADNIMLGAVINTANFSGFTNGKFFIKVEYLGE